MENADSMLSIQILNTCYLAALPHHPAGLHPHPLLCQKRPVHACPFCPPNSFSALEAKAPHPFPHVSEAHVPHKSPVPSKSALLSCGMWTLAFLKGGIGLCCTPSTQGPSGGVCGYLGREQQRALRLSRQQRMKTSRISREGSRTPHWGPTTCRRAGPRAGAAAQGRSAHCWSPHHPPPRLSAGR